MRRGPDVATLQQEPSGVFHILFCFGGRRFKRSLKTKSEGTAVHRKEEIEETIALVQRGRLTIPDDVFAVDFLMAGGKHIDRLPRMKPVPRQQLSHFTLKSLFEQFFGSIPRGNLESNTLKTMRTHAAHFERILKPTFPMQRLNAQTIQRYVNTRAAEPTQYFSNANSDVNSDSARRTVSATTIRKELATFGTIWRWGESMELVTGKFPSNRIRLPKSDEKPSFQTWDEIEQRIAVDCLDESEASELWDCLYLRSEEIAELLTYFENQNLPRFLYPMVHAAAHTGARRSELLRARKSDFDFDGGTVTIRERKRVRGQRSTRRVPMSESLAGAMHQWFKRDHPGSRYAFCQVVSKRQSEVASITPNQIHKYFLSAVSGSKWQRLRGWHCLRHSFISNLASAGVDQRIIDDFVGHTTEEMRRRYRHLLPNVKREALNRVFT